MFEHLNCMVQFSPRGWALSSYEDLFNWSLELAGIKLSTLKKHRTMLMKIAEMI